MLDKIRDYEIIKKLGLAGPTTPRLCWINLSADLSSIVLAKEEAFYSLGGNY